MASIFRDKALSAYGSLLAQYNRRSNTSIVLTTVSVASLLAIAPRAYRDYKTFMSYGPGGVPYNVFGWFAVTVLLRPMGSEMFSTDVYDGRDDKRSWLSEEGLQRKGERPVIGHHIAPQRQLSQVPAKEIKEKLEAAFEALYQQNQHLLKVSPSLHEKHTDALFLADGVPSSPIATELLREVAHIHGTSDYSVHVTLSPQDCKKVIQAGWGQRHPLDGSKLLKYLIGLTMPEEYVLIYAPRNEDEIDIVMKIVRASVAFMTGSDDVK